MFEIGFAEVFLLGVIALLVVGPDRLPGLARTVGVWVGKAQRMVGQVRADIEREVRADEIRKAAKEYSPTAALADVRKEVEGLASEVSGPVDLDADENEPGKPNGSDAPPGGREGTAAAGAPKAADRAGPDEASDPEESGTVAPAAGDTPEPAAEAEAGAAGAAHTVEPATAAASAPSPPGSRRAEPPAAAPEGGKKAGDGEAERAPGPGPEAPRAGPGGSGSAPEAVKPAAGAELPGGRADNAPPPPVAEGPRTRQVERDERTAAP